MCGVGFFLWSILEPGPPPSLILDFVAPERVDWYHTREGLLISSTEGGKGV